MLGTTFTVRIISVCACVADCFHLPQFGLSAVNGVYCSVNVFRLYSTLLSPSALFTGQMSSNVFFQDAFTSFVMETGSALKAILTPSAK